MKISGPVPRKNAAGSYFQPVSTNPITNAITNAITNISGYPPSAVWVSGRVWGDAISLIS